MTATTFARGALLGCLAFCLTSCPAPGKGRKAAAGYRAAAPVIAALGKFRDDRGPYPTNLIELVPAYLPDPKQLLVRGRVEPVHSPRGQADAPAYRPGASNLDWFWYRPDGDAYSLMFRYVGPGMNMCVYDSKTRSWSARGY